MSVALLTGGMIYPTCYCDEARVPLAPVMDAVCEADTVMSIIADVTPPPPPPPPPPVAIKPETKVCVKPDAVVQASVPGEAQPPSPPAPAPTPSIKPIIRVNGNGWLRKDPKIRPK
jgi:hypothetical protein